MRRLLVLLAAAALVVAYTVPAKAADWSFSGSVRLNTFMEGKSKEASGLGFDDDDLEFYQNIVSNIMATAEAGDIGGGIQYWEGLYGPAFAQIYGTWDFGGGSLLVGKSFTPANIFISNQVWGHDADMLGFGTLYTDTEPMLQLSMGALKVALIRPQEQGGVIGAAQADTDTTMPKIEASYGFNVGPASLSIQGGYNSYDEVDATDKDYSIDSYVLAIVAKIGLGAAWINADIWTGQNLAQYLPNVAPAADSSAYYVPAVKDEIIDNDAMGYCLVVGYKASDMLKFEFGYGAVETELDRPGTFEDEVAAYYVNMEITMAEGFTITPEIGKIDYGDITDDGVTSEEGDLTYWGAKWMINF